MTQRPSAAPEALLDWLYAQQRFGIRPGLERVSALLECLGHPERQFRVVLVGGTNGKGSVSATLASILQAAGQRTGLFTSPHLLYFSERFVVDGRPVDQAELYAALAELKPHAEQLEATFFEIVTALSCSLFARAGVSWAVMEVGLGGRLDATNVLSPEVSVITSVGLDHTEVLGHTLEAIATEKAGILREGQPAVTAVSEQLWPVLEETGADLWALGREFEMTVDVQASRGRR
ncbi:bifunctional folylpolyglutamate synthase/dihydrofolate synthase [Deinococcus radiophilus]|uniref:bifunctional folylpolyglutamate synthase/dihydrofolate synthase n=1 Tax=Deinococcus radiophilus TaxID=32062 RepID=UPI003617D258